MGRGKDGPHLRSDLRENGEQLRVIAFDFGFVKTKSDSGEIEQKYATTLIAVAADLLFMKAIFLSGKEATDYSATGLIKFIGGFFHKHVRSRCDGVPATLALANKVKHMAGEVVKLETTQKHSSASNPAERASKLWRNTPGPFVRTARCSLAVVRLLVRDKPIWAWLLRHAGWHISWYKQKGNGMTSYKQAFGEHYTHEVRSVSRTLPLGESHDKKKVRLSTGPGDGGACAITADEEVKDYWWPG